MKEQESRECSTQRQSTFHPPPPVAVSYPCIQMIHPPLQNMLPKSLIRHRLIASITRQVLPPQVIIILTTRTSPIQRIQIPLPCITLLLPSSPAGRSKRNFQSQKTRPGASCRDFRTGPSRHFRRIILTTATT